MKVNWLKVCTVGLEVLLAVGTGLAVFAGISRATNTVSSQGNGQGNANGGNFNPPTNNTPNTENKLAVGLRATQGSMEKLISVVSSLAMAAESIGAIFGKTVDRGYNQTPWNGGWNNSGWMTQTQPAYTGIGLRQVTPFVQEVGYYPNR